MSKKCAVAAYKTHTWKSTLNVELTPAISMSPYCCIKPELAYYREKQTEMQINLSGANDPEKRPDRLRDLPAPTGSVPTSSHTPAPQGYYPRDKDFR